MNLYFLIRFNFKILEKFPVIYIITDLKLYFKSFPSYYLKILSIFFHIQQKIV